MLELDNVFHADNEFSYNLKWRKLELMGYKRPTVEPHGSLLAHRNQPLFQHIAPSRGQPLRIRVIFYAFDSFGLLV